MKNTYLLILVTLFLTSPIIAQKSTVLVSSSQKLVLRDFDGVRYDFKSILDTSAAVILSFWASWCQPCLKELVDLNNLYGKYRTKGLSVAAINIDEKKDIIKARRIVLQKQLKMLVLCDEGGGLKARYKIEAIPRLFILDKRGDVQFEHEGFKDILEIETEVRQLITQKK
jgi:thiol-disulfide isomerase/thioredoxin